MEARSQLRHRPKLNETTNHQEAKLYLRYRNRANNSADP
jgi:hypothetical protein